MAWRDSRRNRGRLLLFISSIILGIGALVAINSFSTNLQTDINKEAKTLLGADLLFDGNQAPTSDLVSLIDSIGGDQSSIMNFASMVLFPKSGDTRLAQIKSLEGDYPYYGKFVTEPAEAFRSFRTKKQALVDKTLMIQFNVQVGDSVKVGDVFFEVAGQLNSSSGSLGIASSVAPTVYIPMQYLEATNLIKPGSRVSYLYYFKFNDQTDVDALGKHIKPQLKKASYRYDTVENRKENVGEAFARLGSFLNLVGFVALLLGCIGVASAVHIYVRGKIATVAVLRCLGVSGRQSFLIYLIQIASMGLIGSTIGALLGSLLQLSIPAVLSDFLPLQNVSSDVSWKAIVQGIITGLSISILFALLPLLAIRKISPLRALRASYEESEEGRDYLIWGVYALIFLFISAFTFLQTGGGLSALGFTIAILVAFGLLAAIAKLFTWLIKRFFPTGWSYVWRQSIANLYRPNNQTLILIVSIGLGAALISTLFFIQGLLLNQVQLSGSGNQPNMVLFDIQSSQKEGVTQLVKEYNLPALQQVPIVTMRVDNLEGITKADQMKDSTIEISGWIFRREFRVTYRDSLIETEKIGEGTWTTNNKNEAGLIPISIAYRLADAANATIGTKIDFNVQGAIIKTVVASIREVEWASIQTNFLIVFPPNVLEEAPQFHVVVSRSENAEQSATFQRALVQKFPNVSAIDLTQILNSVDDVLSKISFVIRFMALFSILTGLLVLISSILLSKYQRVQESVLLRTLGASRRQILWINALEYFLLGAIAALTGIGLSFIGSWLLATFSFKIPFTPSLWSPFFLFLTITFLTVLIGLLNSREVVSKPPLEILRAEV